MLVQPPIYPKASWSTVCVSSFLVTNHWLSSQRWNAYSSYALGYAHAIHNWHNDKLDQWPNLRHIKHFRSEVHLGNEKCQRNRDTNQYYLTVKPAGLINRFGKAWQVSAISSKAWHQRDIPQIRQSWVPSFKQFVTSSYIIYTVYLFVHLFIYLFIYTYIACPFRKTHYPMCLGTATSCLNQHAENEHAVSIISPSSALWMFRNLNFALSISNLDFLGTLLASGKSLVLFFWSRAITRPCSRGARGHPRFLANCIVIYGL